MRNLSGSGTVTMSGITLNASGVVFDGYYGTFDIPMTKKVQLDFSLDSMINQLSEPKDLDKPRVPRTIIDSRSFS